MSQSQKQINSLFEIKKSAPVGNDQYNEQFEKSLSSETKMLMINENPKLHMF